MLLSAVGCGDGDDAGPGLAADIGLAEAIPSPFEPSSPQPERTFVGEAGAGLWVAVVADGGQALAFFCDGERTWGLLEGDDGGGRVRLQGKDAQLEGRLDGGEGLVRLTVGDASHEVRLVHAAAGTRGLYRVGSGHSATWWIQTPAGLKGATTNGGSTKAFQTADAQGFETNTAAGGAGGSSPRRR